MRRKDLFIASMVCICSVIANAQDYDDIYYNSDKKASKKVTTVTTTSNATKVIVTQRPSNAYTIVNTTNNKAQKNGATYVNGRDIDEYNRRYSSDDEIQNQDTIVNDADFQYTERIQKYHNPSVVIQTNDPQIVEVYYNTTPQVNLIIGTPTVFVPAWSWYGFTRPWRSSYWSGYWDGYWDSRYDPWYRPGWRWGWSWGWSRPWHWGYRPYWPGRVIHYGPVYPGRPGRHDWGYRSSGRVGYGAYRSSGGGRINNNHRSGTGTVSGRRPALPNRGNADVNNSQQGKQRRQNGNNYNNGNRGNNYNNDNRGSNYNRGNSNNSGNSSNSRGGYSGNRGGNNGYSGGNRGGFGSGGSHGGFSSGGRGGFGGGHGGHRR